VSAAPQAYELYRTPRGQEWMLRIGDPRTPPILFVPPLFEELNRTRALMVAVMRRLAAEGHGCWLPDLSGTGESLLALESVAWADWRHDVSAAAEHVREASGRQPVVASVRGGCLIDGEAAGHCWWRFAPVAGRALVRDLDRASLAGGAEWAGYAASPALREDLAKADCSTHSPLRLVRLETDAAPADHKVAGPALWRRSEPGNSMELAAALAANLNEWSRACAAS
jgi:pimeloyl-ACP methyl ester carboxylesterase